MLGRLTTAAAVAVLSALAGPASAIDADRRLGDDDPDRPRVGLLAPLKPKPGCHVVRVVPIGSPGGGEGEEHTLLYRPCDPPVELPPYKPYEDRPPILIPVAPRR